MKKFLLTIILISSVFSTSCGNKNIICEGTLSEEDFSSKMTVTGEFKNDKLYNQIIQMEIDLTDYLSIADIDTYYESFKTTYEEYNNYEGIITKVDKSDTSIFITMTIDLTKIDEQIYSELGLGNENLDFTSTTYINSLTDMGLTCK